MESSPKKRFEEVTDEEFYKHFKAARSVARGDYLTIMKNWLSIFPREQLHVGFFEDIENRSRELLSEIFDHIGVSQNVDWNSLPYNQILHKGTNIPIPGRYRDFLTSMYCKDIEALYKQFGAPVAGWLR